MIFTTALIATCLIGEITPLDSYKLNLSMISATGRYTRTTGRIKCEYFSGGKIWKTQEVTFERGPEQPRSGEWGMDGKTEKYTFDIPATAKKRGVNSGTERVELLFDGVKSMESMHGGLVQRAYSGPMSPLIGFTDGPFHCWKNPFSSELGEFSGVTPSRFDSEFSGSPTEVEIYRTPVGKIEGGWYQFEIHYDPAINYLPRFMRRLQYSPESSSAIVQERYLIKNQRVPSGAYLPITVAEVRFNISDFLNRYPNYSHETDFTINKYVLFTLFELNDVKTLGRNIAIDRQNSNALSTPGGVISLKSAPKSVTLDYVTAQAGTKLEVSSIPLPTIDAKELDKFKEPKRNWLKLFVNSAMTIVIVGAALLLYRRTRSTRALAGGTDS